MEETRTRSKVVDTVPIPTVLAGMYGTGTYTGIEMPAFRTDLNTGRTDHVLAIPADFGVPFQGVSGFLKNNLYIFL